MRISGNNIKYKKPELNRKSKNSEKDEAIAGKILSNYEKNQIELENTKSKINKNSKYFSIAGTGIGIYAAFKTGGGALKYVGFGILGFVLGNAISTIFQD